MSYNFDRVFMKIEQVNWQFLSEEFMHSDFFNKALLLGHVGFLVIFLLFKWTGPSTREETQRSYGLDERIALFFSDVGLNPPTRLFTDLLDTPKTLNPYNQLLIIFTSNFIGMAFSRGTH